MKRVGIIEDGLALLLLLLSQGVALYQLVYDLVGLRKVPRPDELRSFLDQNLLRHLIGKDLFQVLENGLEELPSLPVVRPGNWLI